MTAFNQTEDLTETSWDSYYTGYDLKIGDFNQGKGRQNRRQYTTSLKKEVMPLGCIIKCAAFQKMF